MQILDIHFEDPCNSADDLEDWSGVYVILTRDDDGSWVLIDCGESAKVKSRISSHDRSDCWNANAINGLACAVKYCDDFERMAFEQLIRSKYQLPCGEE